MSQAIRFEICGDQCLEPVIGERFEIPGSKEVFAVHEARHHEKIEHGIFWCASHVGTGFRIAKGDNIESTIESAIIAWHSKTPEEIANALINASRIKAQKFMAQLTPEHLSND